MSNINCSSLTQYQAVPVSPDNIAKIKNTLLKYNAASSLRSVMRFNVGTHILNIWKYTVKRFVTFGRRRRKQYVMRNLSDHALKDIGVDRILHERALLDV